MNQGDEVSVRPNLAAVGVAREHQIEARFGGLVDASRLMAEQDRAALGISTLDRFAHVETRRDAPAAAPIVDADEVDRRGAAVGRGALQGVARVAQNPHAELFERAAPRVDPGVVLVVARTEEDAVAPQKWLAKVSTAPFGRPVVPEV